MGYSSCAMRFGHLFALCAFAATTFAQSQQRPPITGIAHVSLYAADPAASAHFYTGVFGAREVRDAATGHERFYFSSGEYVELLPLPAGQGLSRMAAIAYATPDAEAMRAYLESKGLHPEALKAAADGNRDFSLADPEGNKVEFEQAAPGVTPVCYSDISCRIIHAGFLVKNKPAEDAFYRTVLGFRPYWRGSMHGAEKTDWISQQVPDGPIWLEYMMVGPGSDVELDKVDARELGVLNHLSLGVPNMEAAITKLLREHRIAPGGPLRWDGPQLGLDGKWQANIYDPDGTRIELMEFAPAMEPCCSEFTASHPKP